MKNTALCLLCVLNSVISLSVYGAEDINGPKKPSVAYHHFPVQPKNFCPDCFLAVRQSFQPWSYGYNPMVYYAVINRFYAGSDVYPYAAYPGLAYYNVRQPSTSSIVKMTKSFTVQNGKVTFPNPVKK